MGVWECINAYLKCGFFVCFVFYQSRKTYFWKDNFVCLVYYFFLKLVDAFDVLNVFF